MTRKRRWSQATHLVAFRGHVRSLERAKSLSCAFTREQVAFIDDLCKIPYGILMGLFGHRRVFQTMWLMVSFHDHIQRFRT